MNAASNTESRNSGHVLALCGGVGGAKLALGLYDVLPERRLTVVINTGDDFEHLGFHISPDLDTVLYTLAGLSDKERGWGRADETWNFLQSLQMLGGPDWFKLGDHDLALHVQRMQWLRRGETLSAFTDHVARQLGITAHIVPMSDDAVRTMVDTREGTFAFQNYFVERRCEPVVTGIRFNGAEHARPAPGFLQALARSDLAAIVICPSNPYLSIDPFFAVPGIRAALAAAKAPVVAVSPIIGGKAVKGPTAKIMAELGISITSKAILNHYRGILDGLVIDSSDAADAAELDGPVEVTSTLMQGSEDRRRLARDVLRFADKIMMNSNAA